MQVSVTQLRARCAELIRRVESTGERVVVIRRGKPVALLEPTPSPRGTTRPWVSLRRLGGEVRAAPGESLLRRADFAATR